MSGGIRRLHAALAALILLAAGLIEWARGRPSLCPCGHVRLWTGTVHGPENSQQIADWYSLSHVIHGLLFYGALWAVARRWSVGARLVVAMTIEAGWELLENSPIIINRYRAATMAWGYSGDSILNSMSDVLFMGVGFLIARRWPLWGSVALGVALELIALAAIRDNLTLNVLMLVYPVDAIRVWQGG
ncbi:MAG TPA: DUF2585 domain-containing protein [Sphingomonas sp.]|nr:DUF2585 domain-containing protein [Sphingomonas sp.]